MKKVAPETGGKIEFFDIAKADEALQVRTSCIPTSGCPWVRAKVAERIKQLQAYRVTMDFIKKTGNPDCIFLHCLPAYHDQDTEVGRSVAKEHGITEQEVS
ncbi:hypothetical protein MASR2M48_05150 [Spirochaetota bacterium]